MARPPRKITRRDIRKPDQFVTITGEILHFVTQYRKAFLATLTFIVVVLVALWGWDAYGQRQNRLAAQEYSRALGLYQNGQYRQALQLFDRVRTYRSAPYSQVSLLYQANSYIALDDATKATTLVGDFLREERAPTFMRQLGLLSMAYLQERTGNCKGARDNFAEAEKIAGPQRDEAILGKARCSSQINDLKEALNSYRQYLTSYPASEMGSEISLRIQEIEAKIGATDGVK